jgi:tetratricopeptide (TPR) repeat protein
MKHADKVAIQRLRVARDYMKRGERHAFYEELLRAMWGYISDKFNIPVSNLTKEAIREELTSRGMSYVDAELFCTIISRADEAQYAPSTDGDMSEVYNDAVDAISKIESVVKHRNTMRSATNIILALIATSIALVSSTTATYANDNNAESLWADANSAYNNELYDDAIAKYQALLEMGYEDESVYYNLGNAYFKRGVTNTNNKGYGFNNGELGRAILNYERALKIDPEMEDAKYNLEIANELTQAPEAVPVNFLTSIWQSISSMLASNTWCIVSIVLFFMSLTLVLLYLLSANRRMRIISFFTAIATTILFMLTTGFAMTQRSVELDNSRAVVICNDTQNVYSEPKKGSTQIRTCGQGVVVTILDTRNGWTEVKFADGDKGWIPSDNVERI